MNRYDVEFVLIRLCELRYAGTMINFRIVKVDSGKPGESNWFHNVGICGLAPTYSHSITHMGGPILIGNVLSPSNVRQVVFQYDSNKGEVDHTRQELKYSSTSIHVPPRKLLTEKNEISEQEFWNNNDQWFCVSSAIFSKSSVEAFSAWRWYRDPVPERNTDGYDYYFKEYMAKSHNDSLKDKNIDGAANDVKYDGDGRLGYSDFTENIFNDKGHIGYVHTSGYKGSKDKYRHYHFQIGAGVLPSQYQQTIGI